MPTISSKPQGQDWFWQHGARLLAHGVGLTLLGQLAYAYLAGGLVNPERHVMLRSGTVGLLFLLASLACTPLSTLVDWRQLILARRPLGLYGFVFTGIHLLTYALFDSGWDWGVVWRDLGERRAMSIGLISFVLLIPLALTSTVGWQRRLGRRWRRLHRLVYLATPLSVLHVLWLERDFLEIPLTYAAVVVLLLLLRLPPIRQALARIRHMA